MSISASLFINFYSNKKLENIGDIGPVGSNSKAQFQPCATVIIERCFQFPLGDGLGV
jgi:hypothetical protein